jgi:hypothetical protein
MQRCLVAVQERQCVDLADGFVAMADSPNSCCIAAVHAQAGACNLRICSTEPVVDGDSEASHYARETALRCASSCCRWELSDVYKTHELPDGKGRLGFAAHLHCIPHWVLKSSACAVGGQDLFLLEGRLSLDRHHSPSFTEKNRDVHQARADVHLRPHVQRGMEPGQAHELV